MPKRQSIAELNRQQTATYDQIVAELARARPPKSEAGRMRLIVRADAVLQRWTDSHIAGKKDPTPGRLGVLLRRHHRLFCQIFDAQERRRESLEYPR